MQERTPRGPCRKGLSENHLQCNISSVKIAQLSSSKQFLLPLYVHKVKVELSVKTAQLLESPLDYIKKHFVKNDWLKGNKTKITLVDFQ